MRHRAARLAIALSASLGISCAEPVTPGDPVDTPTDPRTLPFVSIAAGDDDSCGLTAGGDVYCWGGNEVGQLGRGFRGILSTEVAPILGGHTMKSISAGAFHACGVTPDGDVYCWGFNVTGQIGDGTKIHRFAPSLVSGGISFAMADAGGTHVRCLHGQCGVLLGRPG